MPHKLSIEDSDIRAIEQALGDVDFDDPHRMEALRCCKSCDIQACPGSGKTTLLVAKLAILANKWRWKDRGILVLSHTNVARQEVQERLARVGGHKLLEYPHFVGTIQKFVNQFLALPYLRIRNVKNPRVDSSLFARRIEERFVSSYVWPADLRKEFHKNPALKKKLCSLQYQFREGAIKIASQEGELPIEYDDSEGSHEPDTFRISADHLKKIEGAKNTLATEEEIFCFGDMYALAQRYLSLQPLVAQGLRRRFPFVLVDEMQDTDSLQASTLRMAFESETTLQRIGDANQAIFGSVYARESGSGFPSDGALQLPHSRRFCPKIAQFATPLTKAVDHQVLEGNDLVVDSRKHTIFTFDQGSIGDVLPAFGRLIEDEYLNGFPERFQAKAVGARKAGKAKRAERYPFLISDYFGGFSAKAASKDASSSTLFEAAIKARTEFDRTQDFNEPWKLLVAGCLEILRLQDVQDPILTSQLGRPHHYSQSSLVERFSQTNRGQELRTLGFTFLTQVDTWQERVKWESATQRLFRTLAEGLGIENCWCDKAQEFCRWPEEESPGQAAAGKKSNIYVHEAGSSSQSIEIEIATIHATKGETHTATLVLDTFFDRSHDLKSMLPFLVGSNKRVTDANRKRMKRTFVAMTRPRELLCLAMRRDHINKAQKKKLIKAGWRFEEL